MNILFYYTYLKNCFQGYDIPISGCHNFVDSDGGTFVTSEGEIFCVKPE